MRRVMFLLLAVVAMVLAACGTQGRSPSAPPGSPTASAPSSATPPSASPTAPSPSASAAGPSPSAPATGPSPSASPSPSAPAQTPERTLAPGMSGPDVTALQQRLAALKYYPGPVDGKFGPMTLQAVWAFQEVQGLTVQSAVNAAMRRALADPRPPRVLVPGGGALRVEISLPDQVLVLYRAGKVALISHISSGGGYYYCGPSGCSYATTPTGDFRTTVFMPGWITVPLGQMYNSVFFIGTSYAIHGSTDVPAAPASHGCIRMPMPVAEFFHTLVPTPGTPVYIR